MTEELTARNTEPFVICRDVRKSFGSNEVLKGISLEVKKGEVVVILGPSGPVSQRSFGVSIIWKQWFRNDHGRR